MSGENINIIGIESTQNIGGLPFYADTNTGWYVVSLEHILAELYSSFSKGKLTKEEFVEKAKKSGIDNFSIIESISKNNAVSTND